ncbi:MAG: ADOP family duplicated permease [Acidobacteriota bacterium]
MLRDRLIAWTVRLRHLVSPHADEREVAAEMQYHLDRATQEHIDAGVDPAEARRLARLEFGSLESHRAHAREVRFGHGLELWLRDLRLGLRRIARAPAFSLLTVLTLALGLGAAGALWSFALSVWTPPLPYPEPERVCLLRTAWAEKPDGGTSPAELLDYETQLGHVLEAVGASASGRLTVRGAGGERVSAAWVTRGVFEALGAPPVLGRGFTADEVRDGADVAVLSHRLWRERFGADPETLGRTLEVGGGSLEIVGVLAPGVDLPHAVLRDERHDVFVPMPIAQPQTTRGNHFLTVVARLREGVELDTAHAEVAALGRAFTERFPSEYPPDMQFRLGLVPLPDEIRGPMTAPLAILGLVVALLLLIAVTNVVGLLLARLEQRRHELALTAALGAGRAQLLRQVGLEHALLVLCGGVGGGLLGVAATLAVRPALPPSIRHLVVPRPDAAWVVGALTVGLLLLVSLLPLVAAHRWNLATRLRGVWRGATASPRGRGVRRALVAGQVALSLVLLTVSGLLTGSFVRLAGVDPGYRTSDLAAMSIAWPRGDESDPLQPIALHRELLAKVRSMPGVHAAAGARFLVLDDRPGDMSFEFEGRPVPDGRTMPAADWQVVTPGYFDVLGIPLLEGRALAPGDDETALGAIVVDRAFAERFLPGEEVVGRRLRFGGEETGPRWATIVGVVGNVRHAALDEATRPRVYIAHAQFRSWSDGSPINRLHLIVDSELPSSALQSSLRAAVDRVAPGTVADPLQPIESLRARTLLMPRLLALLPSILGAAALALAMIGLFAVVLQTVLARRTEIGIRQALGASRTDVVRTVFWDGFRLALLGGIGGGLASLVTVRAVESQLYGTSAFDPAILAGAWAVLAFAVACACLLPARRAARIDPIQLLRAE